MSRRVVFYFLFFLTQSALADSTPKTNVVPTIIVKAPHKTFNALTSGPNQLLYQQELFESGVDNLSDALQNLGGLQLHDMSGNGSQIMISMRGFGSNASSNMLLLVNGIPITNPDIAPPDLSAIPIPDIKFIQIISGSESVLYGDQAVGGIVNIVTNDQIPDQVKLICTGGSYRERNCQTVVNKNWQALLLHTNLTLLHTDNYRDHNQYNKQLLSGFLNHPYTNGDVIFDYQIAKEDMQYPGALTHKQVRQNRRQASNHRDFFKDWNGYLELRQSQIIFDNWRLENYFLQRNMQGSGVLFSPFDQNRSITFYKPQLKGNIRNIITTSGIDLEHDNYNLSTSFGPTKNQVNKFSLYSLFNIPIMNKLIASIGARGAQQSSHLQTDEFFTTTNRALASTLGLTYIYAPGSQFYVRQAGSYRFPKADELSSTSTGVGPLRTQRGVAYETGVKTHQPSYSAQLNVYGLFLHDEIAFDPFQTPEQPFGSNQNLPPTKRIGFSLSGKKHLTDLLTIDGQYNFVNARFQSGPFAGNRIPLVSENIIRAGLNYHFYEFWHTYFEAVFTGNQFAATDNGNVTVPNGGYTIFNANLRYQRKQFTATLHVNNIFNKLYYLYTVFQPSLQTKFFYPAPDRNVTVTLTYDFL